MQLGRVIGDVVATRKDPGLDSVTLLLVQPLTAQGGPAGRPVVAVDSVGAGVGEHVFFVRGKEASFPFHPTEVPADAGIVGIVDHWTAEPAPSSAGSEGGPGAPNAVPSSSRAAANGGKRTP